MLLMRRLLPKIFLLYRTEKNTISKYLNKGKLCCFYTYALSCATKVNIEQQLRGHAV